jgi:hypothetical protein
MAAAFELYAESRNAAPPIQTGYRQNGAQFCCKLSQAALEIRHMIM